MNYLQLGFRNILRNRRRSAVTVSAVVLGFASINLFGGYISNVYAGLKLQAVKGELLGHLTIYKRGLREEGKLDPGKYLFSKDEYAKLTKVLKEDNDVVLYTPRLGLSGMISNGVATTIFIGECLVPGDVSKLQGDYQRRMAGKLDSAVPTGIALAGDLAKVLNLKLGDQPVLLVNTASGQANALDVEVVDVFNTGNAGTNDKFIYLPFDLGQKLFDIEGAERVVVLLKDIELTDAAKSRLTQKLNAVGLDVTVDTWLQLASFYKQVKGLFNMIFSFIFSIVLIVVIMGVINTMSMTVVERTREIGTLRAIGMKRLGIIRLFCTEALLLAVLGCALGIVATLVLGTVVNHAGISYQPPNSSNVVRLLVDYDIKIATATFLLLVFTGAASAAFPAAGASRRKIVDALAHV